MSMDSKIKKLQDRIAQAHLGGGEKRIEKQHAKNKLTARERIEYLLDEGSFEEMGILVTHRTTDFGMASTTATQATRSGARQGLVSRVSISPSATGPRLRSSSRPLRLSGPNNAPRKC